MKGFIITFAILSCVYAQNQDLCANARPEPTTGFTFADDPSDCAAYLWCNYRGTNLVSVHQGRCSLGNFNPSTSSCETGFACAGKCQLLTLPNTVRVAVPDDRTCRSFVTCEGPNISPTVLTCSPTAVFNRNFGVCTTPSIAPCTGGSEEASICEVGKDGFFNDESACGKYFFCKNGVGTRELCPNGFHFNVKGNFCDHPGNIEPKCVDEAQDSNVLEIPKPPVVYGGGVKMPYRRFSRN
ncbi:peritrophin-44-like [Chironomus tepperi]|uniref:peritrophin-44-like n=1 Tax=Chironomus tepperi TaxID=113505 RepID=UPI00391F45C4